VPFALARLLTIVAYRSDGAQGFSILKRSRDGTAASFEMVGRTGRYRERAMKPYVDAAAKYGYIPAGPDEVIGNKSKRTFVRG
jgi:hypothetical protein